MEFGWKKEVEITKGKLIKCIKEILIILVITIITYEQKNLNIFADAVLIISIMFLINWSSHYKWMASTYIDIFMRHKDINIKVCWSSDSHFRWLFDFIGGISISVQLSNKKTKMDCLKCSKIVSLFFDPNFPTHNNYSSALIFASWGS